jgi:hypothetical protein
LESLKKRGYSADPVVCGKITELREARWEVAAGFFWPRKGMGGGFL